MIKTGSLQNLKDVMDSSDKTYIITRSNLFNKELDRAGAKIDNEKLFYLPVLAPSRQLLNSYHEYIKMNGDTIESFNNFYVPRYMKEINENKEALKAIRHITIESLKKDISLVCFCLSDITCHRSLAKIKILAEQNKILKQIMTPIIVAGSRDFNNSDLLESILDELITRKNIKNPIIIEGGAKGADTLAKKYAISHHLNLREFPADWDTYGKSAGFKRNKQMHEYAKDFTNRYCVCFWNHDSKGTKQNFDLADEYNEKDLIIVKDELEIFKLNKLGWFEFSSSAEEDLVYTGYWDNNKKEIIFEPEEAQMPYLDYMSQMRGNIDYEH